MTPLLPLCPVLVLLGAAPTPPSGPHPFTVHDLVAMDRLAEPGVSPDGKTVVFTLRSTDLEANKGRTDLWRVGVDGSGLRRLTSAPESDTSAVFAPDGRTIYFLSTRGGSSQVWSLPVDGGEAQRVTNLPLDVAGFVLSPDGTRLLVALDVFVDCTNLACSKQRLDEREKRKSTGQHYTRLFVRHWDEWEDGRRQHLVSVPVAGGDAVDLMQGMDADCPTKPFGGFEEVAFAPDGRTVVFSASAASRDEAWSTNFDLFAVPADGKGKAKNLTAANLAWDTGPLFTPDGKSLIYRAMSRPGYESDRLRILVRAWPDGPDREVAPTWDRSPGELAVSRDGKTLLASAYELGHLKLFAIDLATGAVKTLVGEGHATGASDAGGVVVVAQNELRSPTDLYTVPLGGGSPTRITQVNKTRLADIVFGEPEQFSFAGANGDKVYGWVVKPAKFDAKKRYPVAMLIHGGPQGSFGSDFHYRWNPQVYAGRGYAAVFIDFHGSTGYGQAFTDSINQDWGGKPLEDLQKGLQAALERYKFLDGDKVCALGASYGGYMVNWIAGAWPDRFRCLVTHDGNLDERFAYYDTEELWFPEWDHGGTPWEHPEKYQKHNPLDLVGKWKTPILVIHGGRDYRVVDTQGLGTFNAAQRRGVPSELLHFPDENHWVLKPHNSIQWHETVLGWLDRWTR